MVGYFFFGKILRNFKLETPLPRPIKNEEKVITTCSCKDKKSDGVSWFWFFVILAPLWSMSN